MSIVHYACYLELPNIALSLALRGHITGFKALVEAEKIDVKSIEIFRSHSRHHIRDTMFLLYEVVQLPNVELLKYLIETCGLSVAVRTDWIETQSAVAKRISQSDKISVTDGCSLKYQMIANPYRAETLVEFAQQGVAERIDAYNMAATTLAQLQSSESLLADVIRPPEVDETELVQYQAHKIGRAINSYLHDGAPTVQVINSNSEFDAELKWRKYLDQKLAAENLLMQSKIALESARACLVYLQQNPTS